MITEIEKKDIIKNPIETYGWLLPFIGHAVQWGEVKTKKTKKEAAKAKAVAAASHSTTTTASSSSSTTTYIQRTIDRTQQQIPQNNNERVRGSRGTV